jgi:hypothetical protein
VVVPWSAARLGRWRTLPAQVPCCMSQMMKRVLRLIYYD